MQIDASLAGGALSEVFFQQKGSIETHFCAECHSNLNGSRRQGGLNDFHKSVGLNKKGKRKAENDP